MDISIPKTLIKWICVSCLLLSLAAVVVVVRGEDKGLRAKLKTAPLISNLITQSDRMKSVARLKTLDQMIPSFDEISWRVKNPDVAPTGLSEPYIDYYQKVVNYFPQMAEAYVLLGFCYYQNGQIAEAVSSYQKAVEGNPQFFWAQYNLGLLYFKQKDYNRALTSFMKALALRPEDTLGVIYSSKVYRQIMLAQYSPEQMGQRLQDGYSNATYYLGLILRILGEKEAAEKVLQKVVALRKGPGPIPSARDIVLRVF